MRAPHLKHFCVLDFWIIYFVLSVFQAGFFDNDKTYQQGKFVDFLDAFKAAARERRFVVREYDKTEKAVDAKNEIESLEIQVAEKKAGLERWCKTHFGEAFCAWIHLKIIRAFVESVLRYGLSPMSTNTSGTRAEQRPNFMLAVLKVNKGKGAAVKQALDKLLHVDNSAVQLDEGEEGDYTPYCKLDFLC